MRRSLLFALMCVMWVSASNADQVTLKNGDRLTGMVVSSDGKTLLLKTEFEGDVTIQWDAITAIDSSQDLHLTLKDGKRLTGKVATNAGTLVVSPSAGAGGGSAPKTEIVAVRNDAEQKAYDEAAEKMAHPKFYYFWSGLFDTGLALTRGNSSTASYTLNGNAVRETPRDRLTLFGSYVYANDDSTPPSRITANQILSGIRGDWNVNKKFFVYAFGNFQTNQLQHLNLRQVYGGGFGYHLIKTDRTLFDVFGGANYDRDEFGAYTPTTGVFVPAMNRNSAEINVGETFNTKPSKRTTFSEQFLFFPNLSYTGQYRFQASSTLATQVKAWLSWQVSFSDVYISYPPPGLKPNDLVLSTGFRVIWGKPAK